MNVTVTVNVTSKRVGNRNICQSMVWEMSCRDKEKGKKDFRKSDKEKDSGTSKDIKFESPLDPSVFTNPSQHTHNTGSGRRVRSPHKLIEEDS